MYLIRILATFIVSHDRSVINGIFFSYSLPLNAALKGVADMRFGSVIFI